MAEIKDTTLPKLPQFSVEALGAKPEQEGTASDSQITKNLYYALMRLFGVDSSDWQRSQYEALAATVDAQQAQSEAALDQLNDLKDGMNDDNAAKVSRQILLEQQKMTTAQIKENQVMSVSMNDLSNNVDAGNDIAKQQANNLLDITGFPGKRRN